MNYPRHSIYVHEHALSRARERVPALEPLSDREAFDALRQAAQQGIPWGGSFGTDQLILATLAGSTQQFVMVLRPGRTPSTMNIVTVLTTDQAMANTQSNAGLKKRRHIPARLVS